MNCHNPRGKHSTHDLNQVYYQELSVTLLQHLGIPVQSLLKPFSFPRIHLSDTHNLIILVWGSAASRDKSSRL